MFGFDPSEFPHVSTVNFLQVATSKTEEKKEKQKFILPIPVPTSDPGLENFKRRHFRPQPPLHEGDCERVKQMFNQKLKPIREESEE
jgi:hypothetical protein